MMTEEQDAYQQALADFYHGIRKVNVARFPEKSFHWLLVYENFLTMFVDKSKC